MKVDPRFLRRRITVGPWPCEVCGYETQFAELRSGINYIFCRNEGCRFERYVDKQRRHIVENDGTCWEYDPQGNKRQVRMRA